MTKERLLKIIQELLITENDLSYLSVLRKEDLETLIACIRDRIDNLGKK